MSAPVQRPRGRPSLSLDEPTVALRIRVPASVHAALVAEAAARGVSLAELVRERLRQAPRPTTRRP